MVVPRAHLLAEAVTQGIFMAGMYQLFCLFVAYCDGEAELIRKVKPDALDMKVGPCCCWPCCCCLPLLDINKLIQFFNFKITTHITYLVYIFKYNLDFFKSKLTTAGIEKCY